MGGPTIALVTIYREQVEKPNRGPMSGYTKSWQNNFFYIKYSMVKWDVRLTISKNEKRYRCVWKANTQQRGQLCAASHYLSNVTCQTKSYIFSSQLKIWDGIYVVQLGTAREVKTNKPWIIQNANVKHFHESIWQYIQMKESGLYWHQHSIRNARQCNTHKTWDNWAKWRI